MLKYTSAVTSKGNSSYSYTSQADAEQNAFVLDVALCKDCKSCVDCRGCVDCRDCVGCNNLKEMVDIGG